jgi:dTDP-4-dehydrorhamnose 3,5-epimerase
MQTAPPPLPSPASRRVNVTPSALPEVLLVEPAIYGDARGYFFESFHAARYADGGIPGPFVQDNVSFSQRGVLRGLHFQQPNAQGKLISVLSGEIFDVAVDVRVGSPTFGQWVGAILTADNPQQLWVPEGFAHGYLVLSPQALVSYKCTGYYHPASELSIRWDDPRIGIEWPTRDVTLSPRDSAGPFLSDMDRSRLPSYDA